MKSSIRPRRPLRERMPTGRLLDTLSGLPTNIKNQAGDLAHYYKSMANRYKSMANRAHKKKSQ